MPPARALRHVRMRHRRELATGAGVECANHQGDRRGIVDRPERASAYRAESSRRPLAGSPCGRRAARTVPHDCLARELDPRERQRARVALAHGAGARMRLSGNTVNREPDVAAQAATRITPGRLHGWKGADSGIACSPRVAGNARTHRQELPALRRSSSVRLEHGSSASAARAATRVPTPGPVLPDLSAATAPARTDRRPTYPRYQT